MVTLASILACFLLTVHSAISQQFSEGDVRLVDGYTSQEGRVEIYHDIKWGTVCDDDWDLDDADIVCRQLGFGSALTARGSAYYGQGDPTSPIWLDDVDCFGFETRLEYCDSDGWGSNNCGHHEDAGVKCRDYEPAEGEVRLVNGMDSQEGRVEIYHISQWGTVCDHNWDISAANVVCHQLGFGLASSARGDAFYGEGDPESPVWVDYMNCNGYESRLEKCIDGNWGGGFDCSHSDDAGIACSTAAQYDDGDIRLVDGLYQTEGRVEIYHNHQWGTICDDRWDMDNADVVCFQLGYGLATSAPGNAFYGEGDPESPIWLDDVRCTGYENRLEDCYSDGWGDQNCGHNEDAGVVCGQTSRPPPASESNSGMAGWLIAIIVISSIIVFAFVVTFIVSVAVTSKKRTRSDQPGAYTFSGGVPPPGTATEMITYPTQNVPTEMSQTQQWPTQNAVNLAQLYPLPDQAVYSQPPPSYMDVMGAGPQSDVKTSPTV